MIRTHFGLASALLLGVAPFATTSHAGTIDCSPVAADVCATLVFACERLEHHHVYPTACHLS